ncbi:hypothetical protein [Mesorhizobium sp.]|uniref:hypothetical protein n=1 Tax=Mesorhizobium sp. TaxID=1871066 RepID=UPI00257C3AB6|nr:hypothetical protein [Mesorhizobium sp.]
MAVDDPGEDIGEIAQRLNAIELAGLCRQSNYAEVPLSPWRIECASPTVLAGDQPLALGIFLMLKGRSGISEAGRLVEIVRPLRVHMTSAWQARIPSLSRRPRFGAVHAHTASPQFNAKIVQRQFAGLGQPQADNSA